MTFVEAVLRTIHLLAGGILTGSVVFFTWAVARGAGSDIDATGIGHLSEALTFVSRVCAVLLLVSGGYMAAILGSALRGTAGLLVGVMIILWLVVTALVEVGNSKLADGASLGDVKQFYVIAAVASVLLLIDAGYLAMV